MTINGARKMIGFMKTRPPEGRTLALQSAYDLFEAYEDRIRTLEVALEVVRDTARDINVRSMAQHALTPPGV